MRLVAPSVVSAAVVSLVLSTWSTAARADDPASLSPPLNPSVTPVAPAATGATAEEAADPAAALAPPPPPAYEVPARETSHWYGGQILAVDGAAIGGGFAVGLANPGAGGALFFGGYVLGGPIVHLAHRRPLAALGSLVLRVGAPTLGALTGWSLVKVSSGNSNESLWNDTGAATLAGLGLILGYATAIAVDSAVIAREDVTTAPAGGESAKNAHASTTGFTWTPSLAPMHGGGVAGIVGRF